MESLESLLSNLPEGWNLEWLHAYANDYDEYFARAYHGFSNAVIEIPIIRTFDDNKAPMSFAAYWATMITMNAELPVGKSSSNMTVIHSPQHGKAYTVLDEFPLLIPRHLSRQYVHMMNSRKVRLNGKPPCGCDTCSFGIKDEQVYWPPTIIQDDVITMSQFECLRCGELLPYETLIVLDDDTKMDLREYAFLIFQEKTRVLAMVYKQYDQYMIDVQFERICDYRGFGTEASDA